MIANAAENFYTGYNTLDSEVEWKCALERDMEHFVMIHGTMQMPLSSAHNLDLSPCSLARYPLFHCVRYKRMRVGKGEEKKRKRGSSKLCT